MVYLWQSFNLMANKPLGVLFTAFLVNAERNGYSLSDVNSHLIQFGFPLDTETDSNGHLTETKRIEAETGRDFSRYAFGDRIQNKRRTMLSVIKHLLNEGLSVAEINNIGTGLRSSRPWLKPKSEISGDLERRYFIKGDETITVNGTEYGILSQWGGSRFKEAVHIMNKKFNLDIKQIS